MPWGEEFSIVVDLSQANSQICIVNEDDEGEEFLDPTPYQTADARHYKNKAMMLAIEYCGREWYADPKDSRNSSEILKEIEGMIK
jgi:hypothetical protein